jgi:hypothetical protein
LWSLRPVHSFAEEISILTLGCLDEARAGGQDWNGRLSALFNLNDLFLFVMLERYWWKHLKMGRSDQRNRTANR